MIEQRPIEKMTSRTRSPEVVQESAGEVGMEDYRTYEERNGLSVDEFTVNLTEAMAARKCCLQEFEGFSRLIVISLGPKFIVEDYM